MIQYLNVLLYTLVNPDILLILNIFIVFLFYYYDCLLYSCRTLKDCAFVLLVYKHAR